MRPKTKAATYGLAATLVALATGWLLGVHTPLRIFVFMGGAGVIYYCAAREATITTEDRYADVKAYLKKEGYI